MKLLPADRRTGHSLKLDELQTTPEEFKMQKWFPRIRCKDCPGKSYNAKPGEAVQNFQVHLNNRKHRDQVDARMRGQREADD
jgi:SWI/SNF-related matrix-associated actin-dependent regulator of chromatin subfamily B protein 1